MSTKTACLPRSILVKMFELTLIRLLRDFVGSDLNDPNHVANLLSFFLSYRLLLHICSRVLPRTFVAVWILNLASYTREHLVPLINSREVFLWKSGKMLSGMHVRGYVLFGLEDTTVPVCLCSREWYFLHSCPFMMLN